MQRIIYYCKKIRHLGKLGRWVLEDSKISPKNQIFLDYLEYCHKSLDTYLAAYVTNLQPYMIVQISKETENLRVVCRAEINYMLELYLSNQGNQEDVIISFAETYLQNNSNFEIIPAPKRHDHIPIFADSIGSHVCNTNHYSIHALIPCGMQIFPICVAATEQDKIFYTRHSYLMNEVTEIVEYALEQPDYDVNWDATLFPKILELDLYKWNVFNNLVCILDYLFKTSELQKIYPGSLLTLYLHLLLFTEEQKEELLLTLKEKYADIEISEQQKVMRYIEDNLRIAK